jgi:lysophospholipid acyltransferase
VYFATYFIPSEYIPKFGFAVMFTYLSALHIYRMMVDFLGYRLDVTALVMVSTMKVTTFACNYYDGQRLKTESDLLNPVSKQNALPERPTVWEYLSYLCYFPTFLSGPSFHYKEYTDYLQGTDFYKNEKYNPEGKIPSCAYAVLECVFLSICCMAIHLSFEAYFPVGIVLEPNGMDHMNVLVRHLYLILAVMGVRCKYYFIWKLSEGAGVLAGLGFEGYDNNGRTLWTRLTNVFLWKIESWGCLRDITTYWNYKTGEWLKIYVYFRQCRNPNTERPPGYALYLTNACSAFWHGFYPGYYLCFVYAAFSIDVARRIRTIFRPMVTVGQGKEEKKIYPQYYLYDIVGRILSIWIFNFGFIPFAALSISRAIIGYNNTLYSGFIVCALGYILGKVWPVSSSKGQIKTE